MNIEIQQWVKSVKHDGVSQEFQSVAISIMAWGKGETPRTSNTGVALFPPWVELVFTLPIIFRVNINSFS